VCLKKKLGEQSVPQERFLTCTRKERSTKSVVQISRETLVRW